MITLNYSPTQKVFHYVLEYASISFLQKLYQVHIGISAKENYLGTIQLDLTRSCFCSSWSKRYVFFTSLFFTGWFRCWYKSWYSVLFRICFRLMQLNCIQLNCILWCHVNHQWSLCCSSRLNSSLDF